MDKEACQFWIENYTFEMSITDTKNAPRPAIEKDPLPQAGESLRDEADDILIDKFGPWATVVGAAVVLCLMAWWQYLFHIPATLGCAIGVTVTCAITCMIAFFKLKKHRKVYQDLYKGIRGERHIGVYLDDVCRGMGYRVLHDVRGDNFNVDHVLIGPGGIFAIETKNWTRPPKGIRADIVFDGKRLTKPDGTYDENAVIQVVASSDFIRNLVAKRRGVDSRTIRVFPVLMLPGWYVKDCGPKPRSMWVFADRVLHTFLENEPARFSESEVASIYDDLCIYVRGFKK